MNELLNCDGAQFVSTMRDKSVDHIIVDPTYGMALPWPDMWRVCAGNIIVFEKSNRYFPETFWPDYQYFWIKPSLPKNTVKQLANPIEVMYVWQLGTYNNQDVTGMQNGNYCAVRHDLIEGPQLSPFQKPLSLMLWLIELHTKPGNVVLDFTAGTGTTLAACDMLGRHGIGCEVDCATYQKAKARLEL